MKYLVLIALISCALPTPVDRKEQTAIDRMEECVVRLIGKFAIKAKIAQEVCEGIHKKGE